MEFDLIIIGSGPGGYVAAIRASQLGLKTAVVEKAELGGVCLNWGCIPTKSLLKSAQVFEYARHAENYGISTGEVKPDFKKIVERSRNVSAQMNKGVEYLFKKNGVTHLKGFGKITSGKKVRVSNGNEEQTYSAKHIILATGARSKELPGLKQDGKKIIGYKEALTLAEQPQSMIVVGSGAIGTELAYFYNAIGTQVTLVEYLPNIVPLEDKEVSTRLARSLKKLKIKVLTNSAVIRSEIHGDKCRATIESKGKETELEADVILSATGIVPNLENIGLEEAGIEIEKGKIKVDDYYRTTVEGIYAIGDIVHGPALAHTASAEALVCVEKIAEKNPEPIDYECIPSAYYTTPEVASVGLTEQAAQEKGCEIKIGKFPFQASGKAAAAGNQDGFVKLIFDAQTDLLLGAHLVGLNVTELISELVLAKRKGIKASEIIKTIHPHPTMSEAIMEAAAAAYGEAVHV